MINFKQFTFLTCTLILASCSVSTGPSEANTQSKEKIDNNSRSTKIKNNITFTTNTLKITQAFLMLENGKLISDENTVTVGEKVTMRLITDDGFKIENDKVKLGASEKITTNSGEVVLEEVDMFAAYADGVAPEDAKYITLSAEITKLDRLYDYFVVSFRVWDKQSAAEAVGSYKFYIK